MYAWQVIVDLIPIDFRFDLIAISFHLILINPLLSQLFYPFIKKLVLIAQLEKFSAQW